MTAPRPAAPFSPLSDSDLREIPRDQLALCYRGLLERHLRYVQAAEAKNRSTILRMAGNIASGLVKYGIENNSGDLWDNTACDAVAIARAIVAEVDGSDE
jgi:hypothetical protein